MTETNPLANKIRKPQIYIRLPSGGRFNKIPISVTNSGEIPVRAMTASDEFLNKNPDALLNGDATEQLLNSCVPEIHDIRESPMNDIELILLAIKYATYGDRFDLSIKCPKCETENKVTLSIRALIDSATDLPEVNSVQLNDGVELILRPYSFENSNKESMMNFDCQKRLAYVQATYKRAEGVDLKELDKAEAIVRREMTELFKSMADFSLNLMIDSILQINIIEDDIKTAVSNRNHITEYIWALDPLAIAKIKNKLSEIMKYGVDKTVHLTCEKPECKHEWDTEVGFDQSNFFARSSED